MLEFQIPIHFEDISLVSNDKYTIKNNINILEQNDSFILTMLDGVYERIKKEPSDIISHSCFDALYSLLVHVDQLKVDYRNQIIKILRNGLENLVTQIKKEFYNNKQNNKHNNNNSSSSSPLVDIDEDDDNNSNNNNSESLDYKSKCLLYRNSIKMYIYFMEHYISYQLVNNSNNNSTSTTTSSKSSKSDNSEDENNEIIKSKKKSTRTSKKTTSSKSTTIEIFEKDEDKVLILSSIINLLELNLSQIWRLEYPEEEFINLISKIAYGMFEQQHNLRIKSIKNLLFQILSILILKYNHSFNFTGKIINLLHSNETLSIHCADLYKFIQQYQKRQQRNERLQRLQGGGDIGSQATSEKNKSTFLISDVIREIGKQGDQRDTSGFKNLAKFLSELSERLPKSVLPFISLLAVHLESESYLMRNAVTESIGFLIGKALNDDDDDDDKSGSNKNDEDDQEFSSSSSDSDNSDNEENEHEKKIKKEEDRKKKENDKLDLLNILFDRVRDINGYCRSSVLKTLSLLVVNNWVPRDQYLELTKIAIERLSDKNVQVRKRAILLLLNLLDSNPYNDYLSMELFQSKKDKLDSLINISVQILRKQKEKERQQQSGIIINDGIVLSQQVPEDELSTTTEVGVSLEIKEEIIEEETFEFEENVVFENIKLNREQFFELISKLKPFQGIKEFQPLRLPFIITHLSRYLEHSIKFITMINTAMDTIYQLMSSTSSFDVIESIHFIEVSHKFKIDKSKEAINKMLVLIWNKENSIKEEAIKSFYELLINEPQQREQMTHFKSCSIIAKNLIDQTTNATLGDITSLEELIIEFMKKKLIDYDVIKILWDIFSSKIFLKNNSNVVQFTKNDRRGALIILSMIANVDPSIIKDKIDLLINLGLENKEDDYLPRYTCIILQKLRLKNNYNNSNNNTNNNNNNSSDNNNNSNDNSKSNNNSNISKNNSNSNNKPIQGRFKNNLQLFNRLIYYITEPIEDNIEQKEEEKEELNNYNSKWFMFTEQAINTIYILSEQPDIISSEIIKKLASQINLKLTNKMNGELHYLTLSRFIFVLGHIAVKQLVYVEEIESEIKRTKYQQQLNEKQNKSSKSTTLKSSSSSSSSKLKKSLTTTNEETSIEKELGTDQAEAETEAERIQQQAELDILSDNNLIGSYKSLLVAICSNVNNLFDNESLQTCAVLTLSKFMSVDSNFCENNLQLLFTLLETCQTEVIRSNIIIGLGDLAFRFPNLIEPWTSKIYTRLRDPDPKARKNSLMVLTHLILNDMIKVKGQISEMAICLEDPDSRISNIAKLFFTTLSSKGNNLYNSLPDIIGKLTSSTNISSNSSSSSGNENESSSSQQQSPQMTSTQINNNNILPISKDSIRNILKYLFSFIEKDKQNETLIEKLLLRFKISKTIFESQNISYCIQLLNFNEKSLRKLIEHYKLYQDKLLDNEVYNNMVSIISKMRKHQTLAKSNEIKQTLDELEDKIQKTRNQSNNNGDSGSNNNDDDENNNDEVNNKNSISKPTPSKPNKKAPAKKKAAATLRSKSTKTPIKKRNNKKGISSGSDDNSESNQSSDDKMDISDSDDNKSIKSNITVPTPSRISKRQAKNSARKQIKKIQLKSDQESEVSESEVSESEVSESESESENISSESDDISLEEEIKPQVIKKQISKKQPPTRRLKKMAQSESESDDSFDTDD